MMRLIIFYEKIKYMKISVISYRYVLSIYNNITRSIYKIASIQYNITRSIYKIARGKFHSDI
jgi:hypothetical protein